MEPPLMGDKLSTLIQFQYMFDNMGKHLNATVEDMLVAMSEKMTTREISRVTNVPEQTLQRVLADPY